jgi:eukaryotic translation initiation factor 2C
MPRRRKTPRELEESARAEALAEAQAAVPGPSARAPAPTSTSITAQAAALVPATAPSPTSAQHVAPSHVGGEGGGRGGQVHGHGHGQVHPSHVGGGGPGQGHAQVHPQLFGSGGGQGVVHPQHTGGQGPTHPQVQGQARDEGSAPPGRARGMGGGDRGSGRRGGRARYNNQGPPLYNAPGSFSPHLEQYRVQGGPEYHEMQPQGYGPPMYRGPSRPSQPAMASAARPIQPGGRGPILRYEQSATPPPLSSKGMRFPLRPGQGRTGQRCIVKANHFFAELPDKDLHQYDVRCF